MDARLALFMLLCLASAAPTLAKKSKPTHFVYLDLKFKDDLSAEKLLEELDQPMKYHYDKDGKTFIRPRDQVAGLLARAADKTSKIILDQYSANDLLALNNITLDDCFREELTRRDAIKRPFLRGNKLVPLQSGDLAQSTSDQFYKNLYQYLDYALDYTHKWCVSQRKEILRQVIKRFSRRKKRWLDGFLGDVNENTPTGTLDFSNQSPLERSRIVAVRRFLQTASESHKARVVSMCEPFIKAMSDIVQLNEDRDLLDNFKESNWDVVRFYCEVAVEEIRKERL